VKLLILEVEVGVIQTLIGWKGGFLQIEIVMVFSLGEKGELAQTAVIRCRCRVAATYPQISCNHGHGGCRFLQIWNN